MLQYLVFLGAAGQLFGISFYVKDTLKGTTKPNRVTWVLWCVAPFIGTVAAISAGVGWSILPVFMAGFGPLLVLIASFVNRKAYWKLEVFDYICGVCSILALALWGVTKQAGVAIIFSILSDLFAGVPTVIKSWKYPETETTITYLPGIFSPFLSFFAIKAWVFAAYAFPIYLILMNTTLVVAGYRKKIGKLFYA